MTMLAPGARHDEPLARYAEGLTHQCELLERLRGVAARQQCATVGNDTPALVAALDERAMLAEALSQLEAALAPLRQALARSAPALAGHPPFEATRALHRDAERLVGDILACDAVTRETLQRASQGRREAAHAIDTGEATLAAYRRVLAPEQAPAGIVDRRG
jgi:hypothetical protein